MEFRNGKEVTALEIIKVEERQNWYDLVDISKQMNRYHQECSPVKVYSITEERQHA